MNDSLTLADLQKREWKNPSLGVLGDPIAHSLSPVMHQAAIDALKEKNPELKSLNYLRLHVKAEELSEALDLLFKHGFLGLNLTVPHKINALGCVVNLSPEAKAAGSVNTLTRTPQGWSGHTTDGAGFLCALKEKSGQDVAGKSVVLLGAGGAARAIAHACLSAGCGTLLIASRDVSKAEALAQSLRDSRIKTSSLTNLTELETKAIIVNCTTLGLNPADELPLPREVLKPGQFIFDTTYGKHRSQLLQVADNLGIKNCDGRSMLRWQGALAFQRWTGIMPPAEPMRKAIGET